MSRLMRTLLASAMVAAVYGQGVIIKAQGPKGPASPGLLVDPNKADANVINTKEITDNVVNECGRTILAGNIDIGETTEAQLGNNTVTQVTKGSNVDITIAQVNQDGAGPYSCDLDLTSNSNGATGQTKLTVKEAKPQNGQIKLSVTLPKDMACNGASAGNVCTIRCFNKAAKGPFGGCVAIQQTDVEPSKNNPATIKTAATLKGILDQVQKDIKDLPNAAKAIQDAKTMDDQGVTLAKGLLSSSATFKAAGPASKAVGGGANGANGAANGKNGGKQQKNQKNGANQKNNQKNKNRRAMREFRA